MFYGTVTPLVAYFTFKKLVLDPYEQHRKLKERLKLIAASRERCQEAIV